jgi:hypothetical protein
MPVLPKVGVVALGLPPPSAADWTQGLMHARKELYHWTTLDMAMVPHLMSFQGTLELQTFQWNALIFKCWQFIQYFLNATSQTKHIFRSGYSP